MLGFGGAFTEASAATFVKLPEDKKKEIAEAFFNPETGAGLTLCRTHINSCDYSQNVYDCLKEERDVDLKTFNIDREMEALVPMIKAAQAVEGSQFKLLLSPWSPSAWMKDTHEMKNGGKLLPEYAEAWAQCFVKFVQAYEKLGINIDYISVQNEAKAKQIWESCVYTGYEEKEFAKNYLAPALKAAGFGSIKILIWDHNRERAYDRARDAFTDPEASKVIDGVAIHWYSGDHFDALDAIRARWPDKMMMYTEGGSGSMLRAGLSQFAQAERYVYNIINDINHGVCGWIYWNLILDEKGGPNHVGGRSNAPINANTITGELDYMISLYYLSHFSKYVRPGCVRIPCSRYTPDLEATAFLTPEGGKVAVIMNKTDKVVKFTLRYCEQLADFVAPRHSIITLLF
jgi:glucosylceramidase